MYSVDVLGWLPFLVAFVWLLALTFIIWQEKIFLKRLFPKEGQRDIRVKFEEILGLEAKLDNLSRQSLRNIQKVGLIRYNPYQDTGGDQSFSLALLNGKGTGLVITSLHTRSGTRVYAKPVIAGKAENYKFSEEEEEVIEKALKIDYENH